MAHPLDGATKRVERADKHLQDVLAEFEVMRQVHYDSLVVEYDPTTKNILISGTNLGHLADAICLVISDCIHNLRSALDYLIYELAKADSGQIQKGTQFPIESTPEGFRGRTRNYLKGLTDAHIRAIEIYQPYKGVDWTSTLRDISNPDKHRHITVLGGNWTHDLELIGDAPGAFEGRPGKIFHGIGADGCDVYVERKHSLSIAFDDGLPIIETLEVMKSQVASTIDAFKLELK